MEKPNNHTKKGDRIAVEPIRSVKAIKAIGQYLKDRPRDHLLFAMGVNNGQRTCDLLRLKVGQVRGLKPGDAVTIKESKTGKENTLAINKTVRPQGAADLPGHGKARRRRLAFSQPQGCRPP